MVKICINILYCVSNAVNIVVNTKKISHYWHMICKILLLTFTYIFSTFVFKFDFYWNTLIHLEACSFKCQFYVFPKFYLHCRTQTPMSIFLILYVHNRQYPHSFHAYQRNTGIHLWNKIHITSVLYVLYGWCAYMY
jgi:hypothetical protein